MATVIVELTPDATLVKGQPVGGTSVGGYVGKIPKGTKATDTIELWLPPQCDEPIIVEEED